MQNSTKNTSFWVFWGEKSDLWKCQFWLEIAQMRYSIKKHIILCDLQRKISFMQVPPLTWNCTNAITYSKKHLFQCFAIGIPICASANLVLNLHKYDSALQITCFECFEMKYLIYASVNSNLTLHKCDNPS